MDNTEFLKRVVPEGNICIADHVEIEGKKVFIHYALTTHADAASLAAWLDGKEKTVYFALASFKETFLSKSGKPRIKRTRKNVDKLKALWLDVDLKDCDGKFPELTKNFILNSGIPKPSLMVKSGNGYHLYWPLTRAISFDEWLPLAEGLKQACVDNGYPADGVCTSDAARVLRPPNTHNRKDPDNVKLVQLLHETDVDHDPDDLAKALPVPSLDRIPAHLRGIQFDSKEFTASNHERKVDTKQVLRNCGVLNHVLKTGGEFQSEPEWNATLLLLKYLDGGEKLVIPMSKGHIDYDEAAALDKFQQKMAADTSGPTKCSTFESYHPNICKACPIYKSKKRTTPLSLGYADPTPPQVPQQGSPAPKMGTLKSVASLSHDYPPNFRAVPGNEGVERKVFDKTAAEWVWDKALSRTWRLKEVQRSVGSGFYSIRVEAKLKGSKVLEVDVPGGYIGGCPELWKLLGEHGAVVPGDERNHWTTLMSTWLAKLQSENAELDTVERYGWVRSADPDNPKIVGFSAGSKSFMSDGKDKETVRIKAEHEQLGKLYRPMGSLEKWKEAAEYITNQNNPAFTSILASAFAAPLITFADLPGAVLTIVSTESGIGKTSALRVAQSVWGSPSKAMNSTNDTPLSITKKIGFLNNLPAFWDEIRGQQALDSFYTVAFDVAQGHEKTRLTQSATLREVHDWQTMIVAASNDSLFDFMAQKGGHSNASIARTFEIVVDGGSIIPDLNAHPLFGALDLNYGHAGQVYAAHLAKNSRHIKARIDKLLPQVREWAAGGGERFWCAIIATLIVAATEAKACGVADIDVGKMAAFLKENMMRLRRRTGTAMSTTSPRELVGDYTQHFQPGQLVIDAFPSRSQKGYQPTVLKPPKSSLMYVQAGNIYRFRKNDFITWLRQSKNLQFSTLAPEMVKELNMQEINTPLGLNTPFQLAKNLVLEVYMENEPTELEIDE